MHPRIDVVFAGMAVLLLASLTRDCAGGELTFELPDNEKQCFYEDIPSGVKTTLEFQVVTGGHYDVDCEVYDPGASFIWSPQRNLHIAVGKMLNVYL